jgi:rhamnose transport system ATP-binding protein
VDIVLKATGIRKAFGGVQALKGVGIELRAGEVHGLIGENGAGKSTLIKIITGALQADAGQLEVNGRLVTANDPVISRSLGIAAIYQQPALFPDLTVAENIALGLEPGGAWRRIRWGRRKQRAHDLLHRVGSTIRPETEVRNLSMPEQQLVEIARALGADAKILIMDEPTASLSEHEVEHLFRVIGQLRSHGVGIIYISHRLEELLQMADRVTVLRDGALVETCPMAEVDKARLIRLMVGREISTVFPKIEVQRGGTALETRGLSCRAAGVRNVSLEVRAGEILGLAGLVGAGRTELARVLFGLTPADTGQILLAGREVAIVSPAQAVSLGIAYVPEDRRRHGVVLEMPVAANVTLAILRRIATAGWIRFRREGALARKAVEQLGIKTAGIETPVGNLSGGNQQKVALARWLAAEPKVLILDEPTQGIDVGAKAEIHRLMGQLAARGLAIIMISSELPEILGMSDRIAVMHNGAIAGTLNRAEATQEKILTLALGHALESAVSP